MPLKNKNNSLAYKLGTKTLKRKNQSTTYLSGG